MVENKKIILIKDYSGCLFCGNGEVFKGGKIKPLVSMWRGRRVKDLKIESSWEVRQGDGKHIFFTLSYQNDTIYQVYLDTRSWRWTLETVFVKWV